METRPSPEIMHADVLFGSVLVEFRDGTSVLYPAYLLDELRSEARVVEPFIDDLDKNEDPKLESIASGPRTQLDQRGQGFEA